MAKFTYQDDTSQRPELRSEQSLGQRGCAPHGSSMHAPRSSGRAPGTPRASAPATSRPGQPAALPSAVLLLGLRSDRPPACRAFVCTRPPESRVSGLHCFPLPASRPVSDLSLITPSVPLAASGHCVSSCEPSAVAAEKPSPPR